MGLARAWSTVPTALAALARAGYSPPAAVLSRRAEVRERWLKGEVAEHGAFVFGAEAPGKGSGQAQVAQPAIQVQGVQAVLQGG